MAAPLPNLLWIVTTQWRGPALGCLGDVNARTPSIDRLAAEGINFTSAVTPHPFGPFARAALLTGVPSPLNGVRDYYDPLPPDARTIAHELGGRGYATGFFGKWHLAKRDASAPLVGETHARMNVPHDSRGGFSFWEGFEGGFLLNDPWLHGTALPQARQFRGYQSDVVTERAAQWIAAKSRSNQRVPSPWFAMVSVEAPHPPYDAPAAGVAPVRSADVVLPANVPRGGVVEEKARKELAGYYAHIAATDRAIGRLVDAVAHENTLVVVTSVHGDMHGAHGFFRKGWPYEESVRVPLIVRLPRGGGAKGGVKRAEATSLVDLGRMTLRFLEQGSFESPSPDLVQLSMPSVVALTHQCDRRWRGVRTPTRKLVINADGSPWLFFDLERDPLEKENLVGAAAYREEWARLRARVDERL